MQELRKKGILYGISLSSTKEPKLMTKILDFNQCYARQKFQEPKTIRGKKDPKKTHYKLTIHVE